MKCSKIEFNLNLVIINDLVLNLNNKNVHA